MSPASSRAAPPRVASLTLAQPTCQPQNEITLPAAGASAGPIRPGYRLRRTPGKAGLQEVRTLEKGRTPESPGSGRKPRQPVGVAEGVGEAAWRACWYAAIAAFSPSTARPYPS